jgi:response regulator RpfG family c-di-GMP phosphodiesterase
VDPVAGRSVLVVDDDVATRALIARQLRRAGLEVLAVESGERVLVEAPDRYTSFDVVILDVHLPGMSGLDLASLIQARRPTQPIVLITGDSDPRLAREALARGPVSFLLKPFEMYELQAAVNQALVRRDLERGAEDGAEETPTSDGGWLDVVETAYMGSPHARRVGRLALALAEALPDVESRMVVGELLVTAWAHELERDAAGGDPVNVAVESARRLAGLGCTPSVVEAVRHLAERHDGSGGPDRLAGDAIPLMSQMVAVADTLEQYVFATLKGDATAAESVDRALGLLSAQRGTLFRPEVVDAARQQRQRLIAICEDAAKDAEAGTAAA